MDSFSTFQQEKGSVFLFFFFLEGWAGGGGFRRPRGIELERVETSFSSGPEAVVWFERRFRRGGVSPRPPNWQLVWRGHALVSVARGSRTTRVLDGGGAGAPAIFSRVRVETSRRRKVAGGPAHGASVVLAQCHVRMRRDAPCRVDCIVDPYRLLPSLVRSTCRTSRRPEAHGPSWSPASSRCPSCVRTQVRTLVCTSPYVL